MADLARLVYERADFARRMLGKFLLAFVCDRAARLLVTHSATATIAIASVDTLVNASKAREMN